MTIGVAVQVAELKRQVDFLQNSVIERGSDQCDIDKTQNDQIATLRTENNQAKLQLAALIRLLLAKNIFTYNEITGIIKTIDAEDGKIDGQAANRNMF